jgi:hypothetical protein
MKNVFGKIKGTVIPDMLSQKTEIEKSNVYL